MVKKLPKRLSWQHQKNVHIFLIFQNSTNLTHPTKKFQSSLGEYLEKLCDIFDEIQNTVLMSSLRDKGSTVYYPPSQSWGTESWGASNYHNYIERLRSSWVKRGFFALNGHKGVANALLYISTTKISISCRIFFMLCPKNRGWTPPAWGRIPKMTLKMSQFTIIAWQG